MARGGVALCALACVCSVVHALHSKVSAGNSTVLFGTHNSTVPTSPSNADAAEVTALFSPCDREFTRYLAPGTSTGWIRCLDKLQSQGGQDFHVLILGGSMTYGVRCSGADITDLIDSDKTKDNACAWPQRFSSRLSASFPNVNIHIHNKARGGTSTEVALANVFTFLHTVDAKGKSVTPDLIITDFTVNDITEHGGGTVPSKNSDPPKAKLGLFHERLIQAIKELAPSALHINILSQLPKAYEPEGREIMNRIRSKCTSIFSFF